MPKATKKHNSTKGPRLGLAFINAAYQRKAAPEPDLKRALKKRRHPSDVENLVALYDAYTAASNTIMAIANQPRAEGDDLFEEEWAYLTAKAWTVAEHLKTLRPTNGSQAEFVRVLVNCAFEMGANVDVAASVLRDASSVEISK